MKNLKNVQETEKFFQLENEDLKKNQIKTREKIDRVSEEMNKWRYPQKTTIVLSNKYR